MHVTDIESIILQHDMQEALGFAQGYYNKRTSHLLKVHTDEGIVGIGEVFGAGNFAFANQGILNYVVKPLVVGRNPLDIGAIWHDVYNGVRDHGQKGLPICRLSGLDIALWDIFGKSTSLPLYQLLGGMARERFLAYGYGMMFRKRADLPSVYEEEVAQIVEMGFTAAKMKIGMGVRQDQELAAGVRRGAGDGFKLMADANHAYTVGEAIQLGRSLRGLAITGLKNP